MNKNTIQGFTPKQIGSFVNNYGQFAIIFTRRISYEEWLKDPTDVVCGGGTGHYCGMYTIPELQAMDDARLVFDAMETYRITDVNLKELTNGT